VVDGAEIPDNKIRDVLKKSRDPAERQKYWEASKQVGENVHEKLIELVELRNRAARELGFKDYYELKLELQEQNVGEVFGILNELARLTDKPFRALKSEIDTVLARRYGVKEAELMPWHYEDAFFQEVPQVYSVDLDRYFGKTDVVGLAKDYYARMGMDVADILKNSDLFERKDKYQHAYCTDIDRKGDVRILENVKPTEQWAGTTLHELGHAVYAKGHDSSGLPYYLRDAAQTFTTEGVAEMFGSLVNDPTWLENTAFPKEKAEIEKFAGDIKKLKKASLLIFARWVLVMANFERELYANPGQDLNKLWWEMAARYQLVKKPAGRDNADWAAKIHFTTAAVYYHNYQLGRLFASQMENYIAKNIAPVSEAFLGNPKVGEYLIEKVFRPGMKWRWDRFVKEATGEALTAKYFAREIE
jgi:peptidyl-dipeptidase A